VRYTDWTQIDYEGPLRYADEHGQRQLAYRRTFDLHLGAEYLLDLAPGAGLRLRAGVASEPDPYTVVFTDITEAGEPVYYTAQHDPERLCFTGGLGFLFQESLAIDAAFATGDFAREGGQLREEVDERRLLLSVGFRLD
jgi:long-subunit fatty acid transport protein